MKKLLVMLCLSMLTFVTEGFAATVDLGQLTLTDTTRFSSDFDAPGAFTDTYNFTASDDIKSIAVFISNISVLGEGAITDFRASLNGIQLDLSVNGPVKSFFRVVTNVIAGANHELVISGTSADPRSSYDAQASGSANTPIPAAVWLFGSALVGLFGIGRRKEIISA